MQPRIKFQIMSDLHFEHSTENIFKHGNQYAEWPPEGWPVLAEYLILAGDIGLLHKHYERLRAFFISRCAEYKRVFFIAGNKDFPDGGHKSYRDGVTQAHNLQNDVRMSGKLKFMNRDRFDLREEDVCISILGCTLWTLILDDQLKHVKAENLENIRDNTPSAHNNRFRADLKWLKKEVEKIREKEKDGKERKIMVVTHHPPFIRGASRGNDNIGQPYTKNYSMYGNDILGGCGLPGLGAGDMWVYGHTHYTNDLYVDEVRVYSNQRGTHCPEIIETPTENQFDVHRIVYL